MATDTQKDSLVETIVLDKDMFGNPYLPGAEVEVIKEVYEAAFEYETDKKEHAALTKRLTESKKKLKGVSVKHRSAFKGTKDGLHYVYSCAGVDILIDRTEKVSTAPESSAKGKKAKGKKADKPEDIY